METLNGQRAWVNKHLENIPAKKAGNGSENSGTFTLGIGRLAMSQWRCFRPGSTLKMASLLLQKPLPASNMVTGVIEFLDILSIFFVIQGDLDRGVKMFGAE